MATLRVMGIDPGLHGAAAVIDYDDGKVEVAWLNSLPISETLQGKDQLDIATFQASLAQHGPYHMCAIEQVGVRPGEGPVGAFTFGRFYGRLEASLCSQRVPFCQPTPQVWKKVVFAGSGVPLKSDKDSHKQAAIKLVRARFPEVSLRRTQLAKTDDHNMAEAVLLALYALHYLQMRSIHP